MKVGGIVLAGGLSRRMGWPKAELPFGPERMVQRVVRLLSEVVQPIVVVTARGQTLPDLPPEVVMACDEVEGRGPLQGLQAGLTAIMGRAEAAYVTSCDAPLLVPAFVRAMTDRLVNFDAAVVVEGERVHPLAGVYHTRILPIVCELLQYEQRSLTGLLARVNVRRVPVEALREHDPELRTLRNINGPDDYLAALAEAGLKADRWVLEAIDKMRTS